MKSGFQLLLAGLIVATAQLALAQTGGMQLPRTIEAGAEFSIRTTGEGEGVLYIVGLGQVLRRTLKLGETTSFAAGDLPNAGHYVVFLVAGSSTENGGLDVIAVHQPATLSFLAKPSRLPVDVHDGISGVVYVFDRFQNLVLKPAQVSFQLSGSTGSLQTRIVPTHNGVAWTKMNSAPKEGAAQFTARAGSASGTRVIQQVPGDPCSLRMTARPSGKRIALQTEPLRDCGGNAVPDGTIVTFTEGYNGSEATVDVPIKRGIAQTEMPAHDGATISVAAGVVMGNEIRWGKER